MNSVEMHVINFLRIHVRYCKQILVASLVVVPVNNPSRLSSRAGGCNPFSLAS
jgi:hypothetical protein